MFKRIATLTATVSAVAILGAALAGSAFAQGPTDPQTGYGPGRFAAGATAGTSMRGPAWGGQATLDAVTKLIGLKVEEIQAQRLGGKSLAQIAQEKNVTKDQLVGAILSAKQAIVDQLVKEGKVTQTQAETMLATMKERVSTSVDRTDVGPANGRGNGACLVSGTVTPGTGLGGARRTMGVGFGGRFQAPTANQ